MSFEGLFGNITNFGKNEHSHDSEKKNEKREFTDTREFLKKEVLREKVQAPLIEVATPKKVSELKMRGKNLDRAFSVDFGDVHGIFKPQGSNHREAKPSLFGSKIEKGLFCQRERAAYLVDRFLNFDIVPPTVLRKIDGDFGSVQEFVNNFVESYDLDLNEELKKGALSEQREMAWVLNYLVHSNGESNLLYSKKDNDGFSLHTTGYEGSFTDQRYWRSVETFFDEQLPDELISKIKRFLEDDVSQEVLRDLLVELLPEKEVDAFFVRVEKIGELLLQQKKITKDEENLVKAF